MNVGEVSETENGQSETHQGEHFRRIKSFVRRESRIPERIQKVWDEYASQVVSEDLNTVITQSAAAVMGNKRKLVVEIGSGQGNQIVSAACREVDTAFVGLEVYHTGVAHTLLLARNEGLLEPDRKQNLWMIERDSVEVLTEVSDNSIDELWTFFPDPWPKKRHHKRRLVSPQFKELVLKKLKPGGVWRLATDWEDYAVSMEEVLGVPPTARFEGRVLTNFEKKGIQAGREIFDFCLMK